MDTGALYLSWVGKTWRGMTQLTQYELPTLQNMTLTRRAEMRPRSSHLRCDGWKTYVLRIPQSLWHSSNCQVDGRSLFRCVSMSTRQMGQRLLVASHWSTHSMWNRCMQGKRLTSSSSSNSERQMVHFSVLSSVSSVLLFTCLYLWGKV